MNHKNEKTEWSRNCPKCGGTVYHKSKKDRDRREREGRTCGGKSNLHCKVMSEKQKKQLSHINRGICSWNKYNKTRRLKKTPTEFSRKCPTCGDDIYYSHDKNRRTAESRGLVCMSCTAKREGFQQYRTSPAAIKKMRATKAGFKSWAEYKKLYPKKLQYKARVWSITYSELKKNPPLPNFKKRGRCGVKGAYQIDHVISIHEGFKRGIEPETIGAYSNLCMIPWKTNRTKGIT